MCWQYPNLSGSCAIRLCVTITVVVRLQYFLMWSDRMLSYLIAYCFIVVLGLLSWPPTATTNYDPIHINDQAHGQYSVVYALYCNYFVSNYFVIT